MHDLRLYEETTRPQFTKVFAGRSTVSLSLQVQHQFVSGKIAAQTYRAVLVAVETRAGTERITLLCRRRSASD